jgi:DNA-binding transcriptional regulator YiaG
MCKPECDCVEIPDFDIKKYREGTLGMSQEEFARTHGIKVETLKLWEDRSGADLTNGASLMPECA